MARPQPVFVGDVQGCADELDELVDRVRAEFGDAYELLFVGDLVNRGPDNLRVLRRVRELAEAGRARSVLGNHDLNLLRVAAGERSLSSFDTIGDVLEATDLDDWLDWLRRRPLAITGRLGEAGFALVHAAVAPEWSLEAVEEHTRRAAGRLAEETWRDACAFLAGDPARDPDLDVLRRVTSCRSIAPDGSWETAPPELAPAGRRAWHEVWREWRHDYGVVYGHWSMQGLHVATGLRGLDTGCVHHGRGRDGFLTAWVPDPGGASPFSVPDDRFWQVPARRAYYGHRDTGAEDDAGGGAPPPAGGD